MLFLFGILSPLASFFLLLEVLEMRKAYRNGLKVCKRSSQPSFRHVKHPEVSCERSEKIFPGHTRSHKKNLPAVSHDMRNECKGFLKTLFCTLKVKNRYIIAYRIDKGFHT